MSSSTLYVFLPDEVFIPDLTTDGLLKFCILSSVCNV